MTAPRDDAANAMRDTVMATVSSSVTFALSAIATQRIGLILNVGCYGGALGGALSAACASASAAASGHAARETVNLYSDDKSRRGKRRSKSRRRSSWNAAMGVDEDEVARDVGVGLATFMALSRGNLGRILPSDVSRVGANAYKSIAARGSDYASEGQKKRCKSGLKNLAVITAEARKARSSATTCRRTRPRSVAGRARRRIEARPRPDACSTSFAACLCSVSILNVSRARRYRASPCAPARRNSSRTPSALGTPSSPAPPSASRRCTSGQSKPGWTIKLSASTASCAREPRTNADSIGHSKS